MELVWFACAGADLAWYGRDIAVLAALGDVVTMDATAGKQTDTTILCQDATDDRAFVWIIEALLNEILYIWLTPGSHLLDKKLAR